MNNLDIIFSPHSDMGAGDIQIVSQHNSLINQNSYDNATALLNSENYKKGFRASIFNTIQNKLRKIEEYLLNEYVAEKDEYYSYDEPTEEQMQDKMFWIQLYELCQEHP